MRKINIVSWQARLPKFAEDGKTVIGADVIDETFLDALNNLIASKRPEEMPRGIEKFRIFGKIAEAFDKAIESKVLILEEREYSFLKETIEKDIPSAWAFNKDIAKAVDLFLNAKEE